MEPVPETKMLEDFTPTPVPSLRLQQAFFEEQPSFQIEAPFKPPTLRRSTEPASPSARSSGWSSPTLPYRPASRNISPYSRGHTRSRSMQSALAVPMIRAQSLPGVNTTVYPFNQHERPASPRGSPQRRMLRNPVDEVFPGTPTSTPQRSQSLGNITDFSIPEDEEVTARGPERSLSPIMGSSSLAPVPRIRRPASPLRSISSINPGGLTPTTPTSQASSPSYSNLKFDTSVINGQNYYNYSYPSYSHSSSSVPSTPTSIRSRSPSISSLETIPDTPDAEEAAIEAHRVAQMRAEADEVEGDEAAMELKRKNGLTKLDALIGDSGQSRGRTLGLGTGGSRDKRKRWSVCGAERRGDLDLETIWED